MENPASTVRRLPNGLLDLAVTPEHLVPVAHLNATSSPLLRLPAEIRRKIFELALSNYEFCIHETCNPAALNPLTYTCTVCSAPFRVFTSFNPRSDPRYHPYTPINCAEKSRPIFPFALSSVCRQLYSETATLPYQLSKFNFTRYEGFVVFRWALLPAQREAVRTLGMQTWDIFTMLDAEYGRGQVVGTGFPALQEVWVPWQQFDYRVAERAGWVLNPGEEVEIRLFPAAGLVSGVEHRRALGWA